ncbi:hypothetical protein EVAR_46491_1 [Eumeta japonica]|uniref:Uncharacterized protein n=1 Tax=Eumeta variegata TaxID=151549 RepID=A0A4C1WRK1_EUMVA|nr:hypothetical protein EVAR_46491_1 [Eumeta japonica]
MFNATGPPTIARTLAQLSTTVGSVVIRITGGAVGTHSMSGAARAHTRPSHTLTLIARNVAIPPFLLCSNELIIFKRCHVCEERSDSADGRLTVRVPAGVRVPEPPQDGHQGRGRGDDLPAHLLHGRQFRRGKRIEIIRCVARRVPQAVALSTRGRKAQTLDLKPPDDGLLASRG